MMDHGHSPNGEEVVMDTSQVVVGTSQKKCRSSRVPADPTVGEGGERGVESTLCRSNYRRRVRVLTRQPLKMKESRESDGGLLKCFLILQTMYLAVCNIGDEKSVARQCGCSKQGSNKRCMGRGNIIKRRRNASTQGQESPKG